MANASSGHKLGQLIGDWWEEYFVLPLFEKIAAQLGLYLDNRFLERSCRDSTKIIWEDDDGNGVDYDFVLELGGSDSERGVPVGFAEVFWRRGRRHSKDKARDDTGKLRPMRHTYPTARFLGITACGALTGPARELIRSNDIDLFYVPKKQIIRAFGSQGLVMDYNDTSSEEEKAILASAFDTGLTEQAKEGVGEALFDDIGRSNINSYVERVHASLSALPVEIRFVETSHSEPATFESVPEATAFLEAAEFDYLGEEGEASYRYEITYSDGSEFEREVGSLKALRSLHNQLVYLSNHMEALDEES